MSFIYSYLRQKKTNSSSLALLGTSKASSLALLHPLPFKGARSKVLTSKAIITSEANKAIKTRPGLPIFACLGEKGPTSHKRLASIARNSSNMGGFKKSFIPQYVPYYCGGRSKPPVRSKHLYSFLTVSDYGDQKHNDKEVCFANGKTDILPHKLNKLNLMRNNNLSGSLLKNKLVALGAPLKETSLLKPINESNNTNDRKNSVSSPARVISEMSNASFVKQKNYYTSYCKLSEIKLLTIGIASPLRILQWAEKTLPNGKIYGEVLNANTLHHKTFKPQKGGLFCERIFGPLKDFECACGKIDKSTKKAQLALLGTSKASELISSQKSPVIVNNEEQQKSEASFANGVSEPFDTFAEQAPLASKGDASLSLSQSSEATLVQTRSITSSARKFCPECDVEYTWSVIRRYQLGYIKLCSPVTHIWFLKGTPSYLSLLLHMKKRHLQFVTYCSEILTIEKSSSASSCYLLSNDSPARGVSAAYSASEGRVTRFSPVFTFGESPGTSYNPLLINEAKRVQGAFTKGENRRSVQEREKIKEGVISKANELDQPSKALSVPLALRTTLWGRGDEVAEGVQSFAKKNKIRKKPIKKKDWLYCRETNRGIANFSLQNASLEVQPIKNKVNMTSFYELSELSFLPNILAELKDTTYSFCFTNKSLLSILWFNFYLTNFYNKIQTYLVFLKQNLFEKDYSEALYPDHSLFNKMERVLPFALSGGSIQPRWNQNSPPLLHTEVGYYTERINKHYKNFPKKIKMPIYLYIVSLLEQMLNKSTLTLSIQNAWNNLYNKSLVKAMCKARVLFLPLYITSSDGSYPEPKGLHEVPGVRSAALLTSLGYGVSLNVKNITYKVQDKKEENMQKTTYTQNSLAFYETSFQKSLVNIKANSVLKKVKLKYVNYVFKMLANMKYSLFFFNNTSKFLKQNSFSVSSCLRPLGFHLTGKIKKGKTKSFAFASRCQIEKEISLEIESYFVQNNAYEKISQFVTKLLLHSFCLDFYLNYLINSTENNQNKKASFIISKLYKRRNKASDSDQKKYMFFGTTMPVLQRSKKGLLRQGKYPSYPTPTTNRGTSYEVGRSSSTLLLLKERIVARNNPFILQEQAGRRVGASSVSSYPWHFLPLWGTQPDPKGLHEVAGVQSLTNNLTTNIKKALSLLDILQQKSSGASSAQISSIANNASVASSQELRTVLKFSILNFYENFGFCSASLRFLPAPYLTSLERKYCTPISHPITQEGVKKVKRQKSYASTTRHASNASSFGSEAHEALYPKEVRASFANDLKLNKKHLYNNVYTLSHRERWQTEKDWQIFTLFTFTTIDNLDIPINAYKDRLFPFINSIYNHETRGAGTAAGYSLLNPLEGKVTKGERSVVTTKQKEVLKKRESSFIEKGRTSSFYSGGGIIQQLLNELDFYEIKKLDTQNRLLLYELNKYILKLKQQVNIFVYDKKLQIELKELCKQRDSLIRRTKLVRKLFRKNSNAASMILTLIPVLPPDLRPIVKMGNQIAASDLNRLYQRVIYRNDRLKKFLKDPATSQSYEMKYAQRLLQEAVDNLLQNGKSGSNSEKDARGRMLKSLSDILKGKQGRFRQFLLGKRVDYSGRSVIVVGPKLKLHECGLPFEMAKELYLPFLLKSILNKNYARTVIGAKTLIKNNSSLAHELLREIMQVSPLLLNRAPTLHRLGIQAFVPKLIEGRAILLHPLVCSAFNADFDGDQMAVHIPITVEARAEAWKMMLSRNNILSTATGDPLAIPSQDMVLGCYYLTTFANKPRSSSSETRLANLTKPEGRKTGENYASSPAFPSPFSLKEAKSKEQMSKYNVNLNMENCMYFNSCVDVIKIYEQRLLNVHSFVWVKWTNLIENGSDQEDPLEIRLSSFGQWQEITSNYYRIYDEQNNLISQYIRTTPGRILFNLILQNTIINNTYK